MTRKFAPRHTYRAYDGRGPLPPARAACIPTERTRHGGFVGNFALSLTDHAQNGFFVATEWIPVAAAALAVGYPLTLLARSVSRPFLRAGFWVMGLEAAVGVAGLALHLDPLLEASRAGLAEKLLYGAPVFAPLLFPNLALLGALGLWDLSVKRPSGGPR